MGIITGSQIRMARGYLRWSVKDLSEHSGVAYSTLKRMEEQDGVPNARGENLEAVFLAFKNAGIEFIPENGGGVGIRLQKSKEATPKNQ